MREKLTSLDVNKYILKSIKPQYVHLIKSNLKNVELMTTPPKVNLDFGHLVVYVYETKSNWLKPYYNSITGKDYFVEYPGCGKVVGYFECNKIGKATWNEELKKYDIPKNWKMGITESELEKYGYKDGKQRTIYGLEFECFRPFSFPIFLQRFTKVPDCTYCIRFKEQQKRFDDCDACKRFRFVSRPPQSFMFVEKFKE